MRAFFLSTFACKISECLLEDEIAVLSADLALLPICRQAYLPKKLHKI